MTNNLNYDNPQNLGIKKIHELIYGIDWWEDSKNKETYLTEQKKIQEISSK
jgi:hypothetical protein